MLFHHTIPRDAELAPVFSTNRRRYLPGEIAQGAAFGAVTGFATGCSYVDHRDVRDEFDEIGDSAIRASALGDLSANEFLPAGCAVNIGRRVPVPAQQCATRCAQ